MTPSSPRTRPASSRLRDGLIVSDHRQTARQAAPGAIDSPAPAAPSDQTRPDNVAQPQPSNYAAAEGRRPHQERPESDAAPLTFGLMALRAAARALARNKLRSALTMLGIFIGVAALIAMVAVGQGANEAVEEQIASLGTNLLIVLPGATTANGVRAGFGSRLDADRRRRRGDPQGRLAGRWWSAISIGNSRRSRTTD